MKYSIGRGSISARRLPASIFPPWDQQAREVGEGAGVFEGVVVGEGGVVGVSEGAMTEGDGEGDGVFVGGTGVGGVMAVRARVGALTSLF